MGKVSRCSSFLSAENLENHIFDFLKFSVGIKLEHWLKMESSTITLYEDIVLDAVLWVDVFFIENHKLERLQ